MREKGNKREREERNHLEFEVRWLKLDRELQNKKKQHYNKLCGVPPPSLRRRCLNATR